MDEATAAAFEEDGAVNESCRGDGPKGTFSKRPPVGEGVFCCRDCGEAFREEAAYLKHCQQHSQEHLSTFVDHQLNETLKHDIEKDSETTHFCNVCSLSFVELNDFRSHMEKEHRQTLQKNFHKHMGTGITKHHTYECPDCGKSYGVLGHFLNHQRSHRQASKSVFHDLEHLKKKSFQCESCGRTYSRASALDAHRRCHEEKLVKSRSRSSGDSFNTEDPMVEAKSSENQTEEADDKLFKCSCGKAFSALMRLKTHQRFSRNSLCSPEETKEKPKKTCNEFYCSQCNKTFSGHIALFNHQRWHTNHSDDSAQRFPCEECGKVFMTLTFYYRHQRTAHSDETPSKSFHHQVCQLQKKSFACKDCGLKFSRASALHSHELIHTDVFKETEKEAHVHTSLLPQLNHQNILESQSKETGQMEVEVDSVNVLSAHMAEEDSYVNETDEDMESYEPGDLIVKVISASESEDEPAQDLNPDLELVCESDQEIRDDCISDVSSSLFSKPEMDLNIVQIDFEHADDLSKLLESEAESKITERYDCPECYRWFTSASSLRVHRMWHGVHKRRQQAQGQSAAVYTCGTCGQQNSSYASHCSHIQIHKDETPGNHASYQSEGEEKSNLTCDECGKSFSRLSALVSHQLHHPKRKQFQCPDCMMSYSHAANLFNHMKICSAQKKENISESKKEYNPKKTLLGPKIYHCEQCGKGFWSLGAYSHHKQSQTQCVDLRLRKGFVGTLHSVNGHSRSSVKVACPVCGRKFRHKGIMALHMRKHENGNHKCELCNRSFRLFSSLLRHQVVHNDQLLPPPIKSFQHQVEQLKKNTYSCPDCGKLFSRAKALQFHMKSHGYETGHSPPSQRSAVTLEDLQCSTCFAHFNNKSSLRAHQKLCTKKENQVIDCKAEHLENKNTPESPKASVNVGTPDPSAQQFIVDTKIKSETESEEQNAAMWSSEKTDLKYKCKTCDRSFSVIGALNFHKRVHAESSKSLTKAKLTMSLLKKPKQEESSKGLFHCSECGRRFMSNSALGSHKRWHKEKKFSHSLGKDDEANAGNSKAESGPFKCNKCGKQFFNHCVLQRHQMFNPQCQSTESEPDPEKSAESKSIPEQSEFSCPESDQPFEQGSLLADHFERERGNSTDQVSEEGDVNLSESKSVSPALKPKAYQCPICSMTFAKARGLRAHKWQAHSKGRKKMGLGKKKQLSCDVPKPKEASVVDGAAVMNSHVVAKKTIPVATGVKKITPEHIPVKPNSCINSACAPTDRAKVHQEAALESKQEIQTAEAEVSPPVSHLSEHTAKCLFKCDKCGKAFQTEEHLGTHKAKSKSRPFSCALCCHGFWTENQLQQHLIWHDEVRGRLPNEVRFRLSTAMTVKPLKPNTLSADSRADSLSSSTLNQPATTPESQSLSSHKCQRCGKAFLSPAALQKHETQHCTTDCYHCSVCPRTFSEIQDLIDHHQECTGGSKRHSDASAAVSSGETNGLTCLECGTTFCEETDLHQHYIEHARGTCWSKTEQK